MKLRPRCSLGTTPHRVGVDLGANCRATYRFRTLFAEPSGRVAARRHADWCLVPIAGQASEIGPPANAGTCRPWVCAVPSSMCSNDNMEGTVESLVVIPKILHQSWKTAELPSAADRWHRSWLTLNPDFEHRFYNDDECLDFVRRNAAQFLDVYQGLTTAIQRADLFRYLVVYVAGGVWADIDMECLRPISPLLKSSRMILSVETKITRTRQGELGYRGRVQLANCIFAAEPRHWFLWRLLDSIRRYEPTEFPTDEDVESSTGPRILTRCFYELPSVSRDEISVLAQAHLMSPVRYPNRWPINTNMFARHHFLGSWKTQQAPRKLDRRRWIERSLLPNPWPTGTARCPTPRVPTHHGQYATGRGPARNASADPDSGRPSRSQ